MIARRREINLIDRQTFVFVALYTRRQGLIKSFSRILAKVATDDGEGPLLGLGLGPLLPPLLRLVPVLQEGVVVFAANMVWKNSFWWNIIGVRFRDQFYIEYQWKRWLWTNGMGRPRYCLKFRHIRNFKGDEFGWGFCITNSKTRIYRPFGKTAIMKIWCLAYWWGIRSTKQA